MKNITSDSISASLPIRSEINASGEELYFDAGINAPVENSTREVNIVGDAAYLPDGKCPCLFFGRTSASTDNKPVPASVGVVIGRLEGDIAIEALKTILPHAKVMVE
ncbi:MAG: hypothetical protein JW994_02835 [Candidatus Omnitrophica bacterium]|nr:hypothetical protein [Candidatus Omnitrophota bacterium]